ncbi:hypothetical protein [Rhodococcus sp. NPDC059234]|uniref:hypothetical protein n=1 Tax=Rhodococcus sp. NPDC059234 TaxID=3346781 RepID=UPI003670814B
MTDEDNDDARGPAGGAQLRLPAVTVAVVTVGAARSNHDRTAPNRSPWTAMERYAGLIRSHTPIRVLRLPTTTGDAQLVATRICGTAPRVSAAFVTGLCARESSQVKGEVAARGGPLVLTELDAVTAGLAATTISVLRRCGTAPRSGRVVVNGPEHAPLLGPTLMKSGIGQIANWHRGDAHAFPLRRLMEQNDVLIDLAGAAADTDAPGRTVHYPADPYEVGQLIVPGLISALCGHEANVLTAEVLAAAARALALTTPAGQALPGPDEGLVTRAIAREVGRVFAHLTDRSQQP